MDWTDRSEKNRPCATELSCTFAGVSVTPALSGAYRIQRDSLRSNPCFDKLRAPCQVREQGSAIPGAAGTRITFTGSCPSTRPPLLGLSRWEAHGGGTWGVST